MRNHDLFAADKRQQKLNEFTLPLKQLDALVNWSELAAAVNLPLKRERVHAKGGRPCYPTVVMLKILVLQQLYGNLSDEETEYALLDRLSWQQFLGLTGALNVPDAGFAGSRSRQRKTSLQHRHTTRWSLCRGTGLTPRLSCRLLWRLLL